MPRSHTPNWSSLHRDREIARIAKAEKRRLRREARAQQAIENLVGHVSEIDPTVGMAPAEINDDDG